MKQAEPVICARCWRRRAGHGDAKRLRVSARRSRQRHLGFGRLQEAS
jgi:hypothetical protein